MFGTETFGMKPDIMTMAKAITSGYLPLSATVISEEIYRACVGQSEKLGVFAHGYTYTGHPAACAVALEVLDIYEERDLLGHVRRVGPMLQDGVRKLAGHPLVGEIRGVGLVAGVELVPDKPARGTFDPLGSAGALFVDPRPGQRPHRPESARHRGAVPAADHLRGRDRGAVAQVRQGARRDDGRAGPRLMARPGRAGHELGAALRRILCISAHPDDNEFTIGGSVARWAREGREVALLPGHHRRRRRQRAHAVERGADPDPREGDAGGGEDSRREGASMLLGYPDGTLEPTLGMRRDLTRVIRRFRPDIVVCSDPTVRWYGNEYLNHPDHRAVADAALDAVFPSSETRAIFPELLAEGLDPHKVKQVFIIGALEPDVFVDITATLGAKCRALKAHRSQVGKGEWVDQLLKSWALRDGKRGGVRYAEAFKRMVLG